MPGELRVWRSHDGAWRVEARDGQWRIYWRGFLRHECGSVEACAQWLAGQGVQPEELVED